MRLRQVRMRYQWEFASVIDTEKQFEGMDFHKSHEFVEESVFERADINDEGYYCPSFTGRAIAIGRIMVLQSVQSIARKEPLGCRFTTVIKPAPQHRDRHPIPEFSCRRDVVFQPDHHILVIEETQHESKNSQLAMMCSENHWDLTRQSPRNDQYTWGASFHVEYDADLSHTSGHRHGRRKST